MFSIQKDKKRGDDVNVYHGMPLIHETLINMISLWWAITMNATTNK